MKLTEQQRNHIVQQMSEDITETQSNDRYYYEHDSKTLLWSREDEMQVLLDDTTSKFTWYSPNSITSVIEDLSDATLVEWYCDLNCCEADDIEEYIADELEEAAE